MTDVTISRTNPKATIVLRLGLLGLWAWAVAQGYLSVIDHALAGRLQGLRAPALDAIVKVFALFGSSGWSAVALPALAFAEWRRRGSQAVRAWGIALVLGLALEATLRLAVGQWRPDVAALPVHMTLIQRFHVTGFPSGHAFRAAFLGGWVGSLWPSVRWGGVALAALVGATRPYLNRHWASDVVGAWLVAWLALALVKPRRDSA